MGLRGGSIPQPLLLKRLFKKEGYIVKKWLAVIFMMLLLLFGCFHLKPYYYVSANIGEDSAVPPKTLVVISLKDEAGNIVESRLELYRDGELIRTINQGVEHKILANEEGKYTVKLTPLAEKDPESYEFNFKVTNLEREIYQSGGLHYLDPIPSNITSKATDILIRFYKYSSEELEGTNETIDKRIRLKLIDTDGDGVYDKWEEVETSEEQGWAYIPYGFEYYDTTWEIYELWYSENSIYLVYQGVSGMLKGWILCSEFASVGFDLNVPYARYMTTIDGSEETYGMFQLRERYNSDNKPVFKLVANETVVKPASDVVVSINATNVARFAELYDVRFMQLTVKYDEKLKLKNVMFGNFMKDLKDFYAYKTTENGTSVVLYRGFVVGEDETEEATTNFATLIFEVSEDATVGDALSVELVYEGWWDSYEGYPDLPNPIFKDKENANVDGFIVNHEPVVIEVGGDE